ncbi:MAG: tRNA (guanosine(37)-N1)-methyltransferase TrmD [Lachnospiraceae bacterium]|nr:tRNA (guanosine(37)-N1)-methyltransferase TrmD [Lachnospiraceae bacterium]
MKINILTLFPEMIKLISGESILGRASDAGFIEINPVNIRDYTDNKHNRVDDYTYGGGAGMLLRAEPVFRAYENTVSQGGVKKPRCIYVTPQGKTFNQELAKELSEEEEITILCGHYEGIDERVLEEIVTDYVSIGDYVLTGGELAAMVITDAVSRLIPGVLGNEGSAEIESFHRNLLEYPQYSRPEVWHDKKVPEVLLSGNSKKINEWRFEQSVLRTKERRPDLYEKHLLEEKVINHLSKKKRDNINMIESLRRGRSKVICFTEDYLLLYDNTCELLYFDGDENAFFENASEEIKAFIREKILLCVKSKEKADFFKEKFEYDFRDYCTQYCYTQKLHKSIKNIEVKRLTRDYLDYVMDHYEMMSRKYIKDRINAGYIYGGFKDGEIIGFIGEHDDGSGGMLFVDEKYRRLGFATELERAMINRSVDRGETFYCHVFSGNESSMALQEKLGMYASDCHIYWLYNTGLFERTKNGTGEF